MKIGNTDYFVEQKGEGPPIIFIAGYTCDHHFWTPILDILSDFFRTITFDNRGIGQTVDGGEALSAELMADDVAAMIDLLKLEQPHIVGQSMGGTIAQALAARHPTKIGKLALVTTCIKWRRAMLHAFETLLKLRESADFDMLIDLTLPWIFDETFLSDTKQIEEFKKIPIGNPFPQSIQDQARQFEVLKNFNSQNFVSDIQADTLVIYGARDIVALPKESEALAKSISNSTLLGLNSAHGITTDAPEPLVKVLLEHFSLSS